MLSLLWQNFDSLMRSHLVERVAFAPPRPPTYDRGDPNLSWVTVPALFPDSPAVAIPILFIPYRPAPRSSSPSSSSPHAEGGESSAAKDKVDENEIHSGSSASPSTAAAPLSSSEVEAERDVGITQPTSGGGDSSSSSSRTRTVPEEEEGGVGAGVTILFSHGNAEDLGLIAPVLKRMAQRLGANVVSYDYVGYGHSHVLAHHRHSDTDEERQHHQVHQHQRRPIPKTYPSSSLSGASTVLGREENGRGDGGGDDEDEDEDEDGDAGVTTPLLCSEQAAFRSIEAVMRWLEEEKGIRSEQVVLYGRSLGGGPTCHLAADVRRDVRGVILQSTFTSAMRILLPSSSPSVAPLSSSPSSFSSSPSSPSSSSSPWSSLAPFSSSLVPLSLSGDIFHNYNRLPLIEAPVFVVHGIGDEVIALSHGEVTSLSFFFLLLGLNAVGGC